MDKPEYDTLTIVITSTLFALPIVTFAIAFFGLALIPAYTSVLSSNQIKISKNLTLADIYTLAANLGSWMGSVAGGIFAGTVTINYFADKILRENSTFHSDVTNGRYLLYLAGTSFFGLSCFICSLVFAVVFAGVSVIFYCFYGCVGRCLNVYGFFGHRCQNMEYICCGEVKRRVEINTGEISGVNTGYTEHVDSENREEIIV